MSSRLAWRLRKSNPQSPRAISPRRLHSNRRTNGSPSTSQPSVSRRPTLKQRFRARADLASLSEDPATRLESLRALASDALAHKSNAEAQRWTAQLKSEKNATISDALLYLEAAQSSDAAPAALLEVQARAQESPAAAVALITWMNRHEMAKAAVEWGLSLPKEILTAQPVPLAIAESYSFLQDWRVLQEWVEGKNWGEYECFRLAALSHALHHLGPADRSSMESQTAWRAALAATKSRPDRLAAIAQLAEGWGYTAQAEDAWWMIANGSENATAALTDSAAALQIETRQSWPPARRKTRAGIESRRSRRCE